MTNDVAGRIFALNTADAYFLTSDVNVAYATGFSGDSSELLLAGGKAYFFTDSRYTLQAQKDISPEVELITTGAPDRIPAITEKLKAHKVKSLAVEKDSLTVKRMDAYAKGFNCRDYSDISAELLTMRSIKTAGELNKISRAAKGNETVLKELLKRIKAGISEYDVKAELLYLTYKNGMEPAFDPIVAAGLNSALPHATTTENIIKNGDMLTIDFGCKYRGYCSDMTRTFGVGDVDAELKKIYYIVKSAQEAALEIAGPGVKAADADRAARDVIARGGYGDYYKHGTGHGVGLDIHELPVLGPNSKDLIAEGMVYTVEPGIYVGGLGGVRIEDMCVNAGNFYTFSKELILIQ